MSKKFKVILVIGAVFALLGIKSVTSEARILMGESHMPAYTTHRQYRAEHDDRGPSMMEDQDNWGCW